MTTDPEAEKEIGRLKTWLYEIWRVAEVSDGVEWYEMMAKRALAGEKFNGQ